jgi:hypothetical protein
VHEYDEFSHLLVGVVALRKKGREGGSEKVREGGREGGFVRDVPETALAKRERYGWRAGRKRELEGRREGGREGGRAGGRGRDLGPAQGRLEIKGKIAHLRRYVIAVVDAVVEDDHWSAPSVPTEGEREGGREGGRGR